MIELNETALQNWLQREEDGLIFVYTPFCGTCKLASHMLSIIETTYPNWTIMKSDIGVLAETRDHHKIQSVPCLLGFQSGKFQLKLYAFHSITHILEQIREHMPGFGGV